MGTFQLYYRYQKILTNITNVKVSLFITIPIIMKFVYTLSGVCKRTQGTFHPETKYCSQGAHTLVLY